MGEKNYYEILGVAESASIDDIKKAYRSAAMKYHPDRNPDNRKNAEERFKKISEAYYVLSDGKRRAEYDAYRSGYGPSTGAGFAGAQGFDFEEILKRFGGGRSYRSGRAGFSQGSFEDIFDIFSRMGGQAYGPSGGEYGGGYSSSTSHTDVNASLTIPEKTASSGGEVLFRHNGKKITLKIKPGTRTGQKLRIRGQGSTCPSCGHAGDLIVTVRVVR